jgi:hypothetical protein
MSEPPVPDPEKLKRDVAYFQEQAVRCWRLAALTTDRALSRQLRGWAEEFEGNALALEAELRRLEGGPP